MKKFIILSVFISFSVLGFTQVDNYPYATLVIGTVEYAVSEGTQQPQTYRPLEIEKTIPMYSIIRTGPDSYAEIQIARNKTIKVYSSTTISLSKFLTDSSVDLRTGKIRAIFKKVLQSDELKIRTDSGIAAVRGTDFGVIYFRGQGNISIMEVLVKEGSVELSTIDGKSVIIPAGFSSTINSYLGRIEIDEPKQISEEEFSKNFQEPAQVQQPTVEPKQQEQKLDEKVSPQQPTDKPSVPTPQEPREIKPQDTTPKFDLGWEVSSQNIGGTVWNKILLSPIFRVGKFGIGLYLVSYWDGKNNIYDTTKWYNAQEYDFGFNGDTFAITDFLDDLFKKILFLSYGAKGEQVFVRIGSIPDMTLGHGFVMDRYSNMLGFPAVRRIGFQFDLDFGYWGFESAIADLSRSRLFGGRVFVRPLYGTFVIGNLAIGVSGVIDLEPLGSAFEGNPSVFFIGGDFNFPIVNIIVFSLDLFADVSKAGIYINDISQTPYGVVLSSKGYNQGFNLLNGEGISAGIKGSIISLIPYRIEYRRITGNFLPSYFDALYDVQKESRFLTLVLSDLPPFNGILGYSGFYVSNVLEATIQYEQLWPEYDVDVSINRLIGKFKVSKELVKMVSGIPSYAVITYQRNNIPSAQVFFDDILKDSTVILELAYSIDPNTDVSVSYKRFYISSQEYQDTVSIQLRSSIFGEIGL